jgi:catechol 2,3-dioxygenase-like lactoylglutathione lyase family enzyme
MAENFVCDEEETARRPEGARPLREMLMARIVGMDHIVLRTPDVERSLDFYCGALGMEGVRVTEWREGKNRFPSVRISDTTIIDLFGTDDPAAPAKGQQLDHYCLVVEPGGLDEVLERVREFGLTPGPKQSRFGAEGQGESSYITGPEGVVVELRHYPH